MNIEIRTLIKDLAIRAAATDASTRAGSIGTIDGYAAKFNSQSRDFGGFKEVLLPGCFKRSLAKTDDLHDVRALLGHDKNRILARRSAGTLEITEDDIGLRVSIHLIDTSEGRDTLANIRAGNLDAMSFGFLPTVKPEWTGSGKQMLRNLREVDLFEVSVVSWARYEDTEIKTRASEIFRVECPVTDNVGAMRRRFEFNNL